MSRDPPQRRRARARNGVAPYIPAAFCRDAGSAGHGATEAARPERSLQAGVLTHRTVATARNRASGFGGDWRVRQQLPVGVGPDDRLPPGSREPKVRRQTGQHCSSQNQSSREKNNNNNRNRVIPSEKNIPDTSQTGRVTGDAPAWPASLPAGASLPGFSRGLTGGFHRLPLYHLCLLP